MRDNFTSEADEDFINKKFWSYVKSSSNSHRIPKSVNYNECHRTDNYDQAELFNKFFYDQFSDESLYNVPICHNRLQNPALFIKFDHMTIYYVVSYEK